MSIKEQKEALIQEMVEFGRYAIGVDDAEYELIDRDETYAATNRNSEEYVYWLNEFVYDFETDAVFCTYHHYLNGDKEITRIAQNVPYKYLKIWWEFAKKRNPDYDWWIEDRIKDTEEKESENEIRIDNSASFRENNDKLTEIDRQKNVSREDILKMLHNYCDFIFANENLYPKEYTLQRGIYCLIDKFVSTLYTGTQFELIANRDGSIKVYMEDKVYYIEDEEISNDFLRKVYQQYEEGCFNLFIYLIRTNQHPLFISPLRLFNNFHYYIKEYKKLIMEYANKNGWIEELKQVAYIKQIRIY